MAEYDEEYKARVAEERRRRALKAAGIPVLSSPSPPSPPVEPEPDVPDELPMLPTRPPVRRAKDGGGSAPL